MKILISGAGVAGAVLAHFLGRAGADVTVVERAPVLRTGGQPIDIRGAALAVAERMGVLEEARALRTTPRGMSMVDRDGAELMRDTEATISGGRIGGPDIEILRGDLVSVLTAASPARRVYGDSIAALAEDGEVTFEGGGRGRYDHVIGTDGLHSRVRALAFGPEERYIHHLGQYISVFTADNFLGLDHWQTWFGEGGAGGVAFSDRDRAKMIVNLGFESPPLAYDHRDAEQQKRLIEERCGRLWEAPRLIEAMWKADDFHFGPTAQIRMDRWSTGRVTLVGDAGYCASPLSGQGTSLAMVGAYVLAEELLAEPEGAGGRYERRMRPFVAANQALVDENPGGPAPMESVQRAANAISLG